eukprot:6420750-Pyramimonas_sp.AAC.1
MGNTSLAGCRSLQSPGTLTGGEAEYTEDPRAPLKMTRPYSVVTIPDPRATSPGVDCRLANGSLSAGNIPSNIRWDIRNAVRAEWYASVDSRRLSNGTNSEGSLTLGSTKFLLWPVGGLRYVGTLFIQTAIRAGSIDIFGSLDRRSSDLRLKSFLLLE